MKKIFLLVVAALAVGYYCYSKYYDPGVTYKVKNNSVTISDKYSKISFTRADPFEISGYVSSADDKKNDQLSVFAGVFDIVHGNTAIEFATLPNDNKPVELSSLSAEAQRILKEQKCQLGYVKDHTMSLIAVTENAGTDKLVRGIKQGDMVDIKGYKVKIDSAKVNRERINAADFQNTVCVTELSIRSNPAAN
jgi:hypothetical protein